MAQFQSQSQNSCNMFDFKRIITPESNVEVQVNSKSCIDCLVVINLALVCQESNKQQGRHYNLVKKILIFYCHCVGFYPYLFVNICTYDSVCSCKCNLKLVSKWKKRLFFFLFPLSYEQFSVTLVLSKVGRVVILNVT